MSQGRSTPSEVAAPRCVPALASQAFCAGAGPRTVRFLRRPLAVVASCALLLGLTLLSGCKDKEAPPAPAKKATTAAAAQAPAEAKSETTPAAATPAAAATSKESAVAKVATADAATSVPVLVSGATPTPAPMKLSAADEATTGVLFRLSGLVVTPDDKAVSSGLVTLYKFNMSAGATEASESEKSLEPVREVALSAGGKFEFTAPGVEMLPYVLMASHDGFADSGGHYVGAYPGQSGTSKLPGGGTLYEVSKVTLKLNRAGRIAGKVVDAAGKGVAGAKLGFSPKVTDTRQVRLMMPMKATTDATGAFEIEKLVAGATTVRVAAEGFARLTTTLEAPTQDAVIKLKGGGATIAGRVFDKDTGKPVAGAMVMVVNEKAANTSMAAFGDAPKTTTDSTGAYQLTGLEAGDYIAVCSGKSYYPVGTSTPPYMPRVSVKADEVRTDFDLFMDHGRTIKGIVVETGTGKPVEGVKVAAQNYMTMIGRGSDGGGKYEETTLADGTFELKNISVMPSGDGAFSASISVEKKDWTLIKSSGPRDNLHQGRIWMRIEGESKVVERKFEISQGMRMNGIVVDRNGLPVADATVSPMVMRTNPYGGSNYDGPNQTTAAKTGADGRFSVNVVTGTRVGLLAKKDGVGQGKLDYVAIGTKEPAEVKIKLLSARIEGIALLDDSKPLAGVTVNAQLEVTNDDGGGMWPTVATATTTADGRFVFDGLPPGSIMLSGTHEEYVQSESPRETLSDGERKSGVKLLFVQGKVLAGRVLTAAGEPVSGAHINAYGSRTGRGDQTTSDENGKYRLKKLLGDKINGYVWTQTGVNKQLREIDIPNENYDIILGDEKMVKLVGTVIDAQTKEAIADFTATVSGQRMSPVTRVEGKENVFEAEVLAGQYYSATVKATGYPEFSDGGEAPETGVIEKTFELQKGGRVVGRVLKADEKGGGATVAASGVAVEYKGRATESYNFRWRPAIATVTTDEEGKFAFDNVAAGEQMFWIKPAEDVSRMDRKATVKPGETADLGDIVLGTGATIRVQVVQGEKPVAGLRVSSYLQGTNENKSQRTGEDGRAEFKTMPSGTYSISLERGGSKSVKVAENETVDVAFSIGTGVFSGRVTSKGKPVSGYISISKDEVGLGDSFDNGEFKIEGISAGTWKVNVNVRDSNSYRNAGRPKTDTITIAEGQTLKKDYDFVVGTIRGKVVDQQDKPVAKARVSVLAAKGSGAYDETFQWGDERQTDSSGNFSFNGVAPAKYGVTASKEGVGMAIVQGVEVREDGGDPEPLVIKLGENNGGTIVSLVKNMASGAAVPEAWCYLSNENGRFDHGQRRDKDGKMTISNIPSGTYQMQVSSFGYSIIERSVVIEAGKTLTFDDELYDAGALRLTLLLAKGQPATGARVSMTAADADSPELPRDGKTDSTGLCVVRGLFPGDYTITATSQDGATSWTGRCTILGHEVTTLELLPGGVVANPTATPKSGS